MLIDLVHIDLVHIDVVLGGVVLADLVLVGLCPCWSVCGCAGQSVAVLVGLVRSVCASRSGRSARVGLVGPV
ncbi:hypothetical protein [Streptomyces antimycoticus]|uniref:hypothetical protein n=1 Tax=Streptomyces antimycoticus TaxID=68175 RepID=UPI001386A7CA|nr:hypothetical protein [Streptomyces antimycoticus]